MFFYRELFPSLNELIPKCAFDNTTNTVLLVIPSTIDSYTVICVLD